MTARLLCLAGVLAALVAVASALTVHLVPHTHDDVGWLKTVDQYYVGSHEDIQDAAVQHVLTSVVAALKRVPERKFIYVEQAFFQRWWRQQNDAMKSDVQALVANGQLEFINGGWCMHDEAAAHYIDMIDQTTLGHLFIREQFGEEHIPTVGWQIDPFGHSATQAALLSAAVGFDGLFFGRIDYQDRTNRLLKKELEMVWSASPSYGPSNYVFAGAMDGYGPPDGLCWDETCGDEPIQNDPRLDDLNSERITEKIVRAALSQAAGTRGDLATMNIMWTMGSDFNYENAEEWFINLDKAIQLANANGTVQLIYSTPSQYIKAKNAEAVQWPTKYDDFFPYADGRDGYWTGYFTSRPALKGYVRTSSSHLQVVRHFEVFSGGDGSASEMFWEAVSVAQHHDGVSGTAKQAVTFDYAQRISVGAAVADEFLGSAIGRIVSMTGKADVNFTYCPLANVSVCDATRTASSLAAVIYNPSARALSITEFVGAVVRIPVYSRSYQVYDANRTLIPNQQVVPVLPTRAQPADAATHEVVINTDVAGLGIETVFLQRGNRHTASELEAAPPGGASIENEFYTIQFDNVTGLISSITTKLDGVSRPFVQDFAYYAGYQQDNQQDSGAYIFRPAFQHSVPLTTSDYPAQILGVIKGDVVQQVWQQVSEWVVQKITLYQGRPAIEFEWTVGPVPVDDGIGKEVIIRFNSSIASQATWYTDSNGREFQKRVRDYRPTWKWVNTQPIAGNYYPVNAVQWLADDDDAMVVLNDRSQGGASMADGSLEFMVHRRLLKDDGRGVDEALNEPGLDGKGLIVTGRHYVSLVDVDEAAQVARAGQNLLYNSPHVALAPVQSVATYAKSHYTNLTFLATDLPLNVELITAQVRPNGETLVRLAHQFGVGEDPDYSVPVTVDLSTLFNQGVGSVTELSLSAAYPAGSHKPYQWNTTDGSVGRRGPQGREGRADSGKLTDTSVTLQPLEIRTFSISF